MPLFATSPSDPNAQGLPRGEVLGTYSSYQQAREVVDRLASAEFDVTQVSIVGTDLRMVERVRGKLTYASVALRSGLQGALFGGMLGLLLSLVDSSQMGMQILATAAIGAAIWIIMGVIGMSVRKGRGGGFDSVQQLVPTSFDVVCAFEASGHAQAVLRGGGGSGQAPVQTPVQTPGQTPAPSQPQPPSAEPGPAQPPVQAPAAGQGSSGAGSHAAAAPGQQDRPGQQDGPGQAEASGPAPERDWSYPDLPDGRPQYGVRLPDAEAQELRTRILKEQGLSANASGGTQTFEEPAYAKGRRARRSDEAAAPVQTPQPSEQVEAGGVDDGDGQDRPYRRPRYGRHEQPAEETPEREPSDSER